MAWEKRKSKSYFYLHQRLPDGRKVKEYFGRGVDAHMASGFLQLRKFAKWSQQRAMSELRTETQEADELLNNYSESVSEFVAAEMLAVGYHNSRSRGWRKMMKTDLNPEKEMAKDSAVSTKKKVRASQRHCPERWQNLKAKLQPCVAEEGRFGGEFEWDCCSIARTLNGSSVRSKS